MRSGGRVCFRPIADIRNVAVSGAMEKLVKQEPVEKPGVKPRAAVFTGIATVAVLAVPTCLLITGFFAWISQSP